jgi:hypothetical protein
MKTERVYPEMASAMGEPPRSQRPVTGESSIEAVSEDLDVEVETDWVEPAESGDITSPHRSQVSDVYAAADDDPPSPDHSSKRLVNNLKTAEVNLERDRRQTLTSPIPALLAESMLKEPGSPPAAETRDPAAPEPERAEQTRRLGDSDQHIDRDTSAGYTVELVDDGNAERRKRAALLIDRVRACFDAGDLPAAAHAAEAALDEADQAAPPGLVEVIEPARPLLARVFAAFVGPLTEVPVLGRRSEEIAALRLDDRRRAVVARVDGVSTLDQILDGARIPAADALRVAASLLQAGIIRVV